ncbi:KxYKxGKxW signal peptide domain-containing protein [Leuconostoc citreum]|uniref:KxYKxGKxW signal peptide domain-containing protein n=1 Tax=Leuconostoc citreum TaxID=33964 RepID=UPI00200B427E|nr:KxYKxGKxW signal peptide domain-containing protein [Leuconostoc citreum]MCK8605663.1 KxYKxGKxW signal peptide domain-containing protein [Leuconostoc citreum]
MKTKTHYKLYKDGKKWVVGAIAVAGITATQAITYHVSADSALPTATTAKATVPQSDSSTTNGTPQATKPEIQSTGTEPKDNAVVAKPVEKATSTIPTNVPAQTSQEDAQKAIDKSQEVVKGSATEATKAGVKVVQEPTTDVTLNNENAATKSQEVMTDLNRQDAALKQATVIQKANDEDKKKADEQYQEVLKKSQADVAKSHDTLAKAVDNAKASGVKVSVVLSESSPAYKSLKGLTGQAMLTAMAANLKLYQQSVANNITKETMDTKVVDALAAEYRQQVADFGEAQAKRSEAIAKGQADLSHSNAELEEQLAIAKKLGIDVSQKKSDLTPKYIDTTGMVGSQLLNAMRENIRAYVAANANGMDKQGQSAKELKAALAAYQKADADYKAGIATLSGVKWKNGTTVSAGNGAQQMSGGEQVVSFGDGTLKTAAMSATQGNYSDQNTDANFNNIFKINGSGTINVRNTTNGNVTLTFSSIDSPFNTGTYVAIWGANDGGIAWSVFATYSGNAQSGAGESGGGSASIASGKILNYVHGYDVTVDADGNVSVVTANDIDNNQTITVNGLDGQVTVGKNVSQNGNSFSAGGGDVSQGSNGNLSSNGVRWLRAQPGHVRFSMHHSTTDRQDTSLVAGIFGSDSQIPLEPVKPPLSAESFTINSPKAAELPKVPEVVVTKRTTTVLPKAENPAQQKASYKLYKVATTAAPVVPEAPTVQPQPVSTPAPQSVTVLPQTAAAVSHYDAKQIAMAGLAVTLMSLGVVVAKRKYQQSDKQSKLFDV